MTILVVDIETVPDEAQANLFFKFNEMPDEVLDKLYTSELDGTREANDVYAEAVDKWRISQMSLTPEYCRIVGLNAMLEHYDPVSNWVGEPVMLDRGGVLYPSEKEYSETGLLRTFWQLTRENSQIVTFNGLSFDLEVIKMRSAILGVEPLVNLTELKPWENRVIDLMKKMYANRKAMGLKKIRQLHWNRLIEFEPRLLAYEDLMAMEGSSVYELYQKGDYATLRHYGEFDVLTNWALYLFGKGYWW